VPVDRGAPPRRMQQSRRRLALVPEQNPHALYLRDLSHLLVEEARRASAAARANPEDWENAYLTAFVQVLDLMRNQAVAFGIALSDLGPLAELDPERELLTRRPVD
jgi:hypothetical protein